MDSAVNWPDLVFTSAFMARIDRMALKRFGQPGLAEEAASHVITGLGADDWAACRTYTGKAKPESFLITLTAHLLEDFSRRRFGRPRPPEWLKREGNLWVEVWNRVCLQRQLPQSVIDALQSAQRAPDFISGIIRTIKAKLPWCGESAREIPDDCQCAFSEETANSPDQQLTQSGAEQQLANLYQWFFSEHCPSVHGEPTPDQRQWHRFYQSLSLTPQERLLLRLVHQEGLKLNTVASQLGLPAYMPGRLLKAIYARIRAALTQSGIQLPQEELA